MDLSEDVISSADFEEVLNDVEEFLFNDDGLTGPIGSTIGIVITVALVHDLISPLSFSIWVILSGGAAVHLLFASSSKRFRRPVDRWGVPIAVNAAAATIGVLYGSLPWLMFDSLHLVGTKMVAANICLGITCGSISGRAGVGGQGTWLIWPMWTMVFLAMAASGQWILATTIVAFIAFLVKNMSDTSGIVLEVLAMRQITRSQAERAQTASMSDPLTGLMNRNGLARRTSELDASGFTVYFVDLDGFKAINDQFGHHYGDVVLTEVAKKLSSVTGEKGLVGRFGGDEFIVVTYGIQTESDEDAMATEIIDVISQPTVVHDMTLTIGASIGVATSDGDSDLAEVQQRADQALYWAKSNAKGTGARFAKPEVSEVPPPKEIYDALTSGQISFWGQPIIDNSTGAVTMVEMLARWERQTGEFLSPASFLHSIVRLGLSNDLSQLAVAAAGEALSRWSRHPALADVAVSINIDGGQLEGEAMKCRILQMCRTLGVSADKIVFELLETSNLNNAKNIERQLQPIRSTGAKIAIDDFGAGRSRLATIVDLPIDIVKIDRTLVTSRDEPTLEILLRSIRDICAMTGKSIVVEGIEHRWQHDVATELGIEFSQGIWLCPPQRQDRLDEFILARNSRLPATATDVRL